MVKNKNYDDGLSCQKYGVPLYGAAWLPPSAFPEAKIESEYPESSIATHVILAGGGGEGSSGIPNAILLSAFDFKSNSLSDHPVAKLGTGSDLPYRIAVHPGGEGILCSSPKSCRWFKFVAVVSKDKHILSLKASDKVLEQLEEVGQLLAMTFNGDGSLLAVGGKEDGMLKVFKWPSMETTLDEANAHASVKDLDFSPDGKFLISVGSGSGAPGRIWNTTTSTSVASLPKEMDEIFSFARFSQANGTGTDQVLYITSMRDKGGSIMKWDATKWKRLSSTHVSRDPISAFNVSHDGKLLAIGTGEGDIKIIRCVGMRVQATVKKAHLGVVTALAFSHDSRALISASFDSSARVTLMEYKKKGGMRVWILLAILVIVVAVYYAKIPSFKF